MSPMKVKVAVPNSGTSPTTDEMGVRISQATANGSASSPAPPNPSTIVSALAGDGALLQSTHGCCDTHGKPGAGHLEGEVGGEGLRSVGQNDVGEHGGGHGSGHQQAHVEGVDLLLGESQGDDG